MHPKQHSSSHNGYLSYGVTESGCVDENKCLHFPVFIESLGIFSENAVFSILNAFALAVPSY